MKNTTKESDDISVQIAIIQSAIRMYKVAQETGDIDYYGFLRLERNIMQEKEKLKKYEQEYPEYFI